MEIEPPSLIRGWPKKKRAAGKTKQRKRARTGPYSEGGFYAPGASRWGPETKYFDTSFTMTAGSGQTWADTEMPCIKYIAGDGTTTSDYTASALIPSAQGTGYGQVIGNKYQLRKIRLKGHIFPVVATDQADVAANAFTRIVLVLDTQPNGTQAQGEDIFNDMGSAAASNYSFLAMGKGAGGRYQILKDKIYRNEPASAGTDGANTNSTVRSGNHWKINYNFRDPYTVQLKVGAATPAVAQLQNCNIFLLCHSTSSTITVTGVGRAYYSD